MKIKILSLGEKPPKWVSQGYDEYKKRLSKSIPLELIELPIAKRTKTGNPKLWMEQESKTILGKLNPSDSSSDSRCSIKSYIYRRFS